MAANNQRDFSRVNSAHNVRIEADGHDAISCTLRDVSATGLYVHSESTLPENTPCAITVVLTDDADGIGVRARGRIVRMEADGMAVHIDTIVGENSFEHLRRLIMYNAPEPNRAQNEFQDHIGIKARDAQSN